MERRSPGPVVRKIEAAEEAETRCRTSSNCMKPSKSISSRGLSILRELIWAPACAAPVDTSERLVRRKASEMATSSDEKVQDAASANKVAVAGTSEPRRKNNRQKSQGESPKVQLVRLAMQVVTFLAILVVGLAVVFRPEATHSPTSRVILFFFLSMVPAILFGDWVSAKFHASIQVAAVTTAGTFGTILASLFALFHFTGTIKIADIYKITDCVTNNPVSVENVSARALDHVHMAPEAYKTDSAIFLSYLDDQGPVEISVMAKSGNEFRATIQSISTQSIDFCLGGPGELRPVKR